MQLITLLAMATGALALPTQTSQQLEQRAAALSFTEPWTLTKVKLVTAEAPKNSSLSFHFSDVNAGLELETDCAYTAPSVIGTSYHQCSNRTVAFYYDGTKLEVERAYHDSALGEPPYDQGVAFGTGKPAWRNHTNGQGALVSKVKKLSVPVDRLIAKK